MKDEQQRLASDGHLALLDESLSGLLVGVGTVTERKPLDTDTCTGLEVLFRIRRSVHLPEVVGDSLVVRLGGLEGLEGKTTLGSIRDLLALLPFGENQVVVGRRGDDGHARVVLGGCAEEGDTSDVDFLNGTRDSAVRLLSLKHERVQVAHDEGDGRDRVGSEVRKVRVDLTGENAWTSTSGRVFSG